MQAITFTEYGSPDVLKFEEIEKPTPQANEVLVKVHAASANPADWHIMRGEPVLARLSFGLRKPKINQLGADIAGVVEAVGSGITEFKVGDRVFGELPLEMLGGFAEHACANEKDLVHMPENATFEDAAALPMTGLTAIQGLRDTGNIHAGQNVLVNGASGGVGTFAVQYAKACGAEVTGVCSGRNIDLVCSIGADHAIDYTKTDFAKTGEQYDLIYDAVGNRTAADYAAALKPNGRCVIAGFTTMGHMLTQVALLGSLRSTFTDKTIGIMPTAHIDKSDLMLIAELLETGKVKPVIDRRYPLSETAEAIRYLETSRARGKVIINMVH